MQKENAKVFYLDNLKVFLTILVVLHHVAITYGADGGWFYREVNQTVMPDSVILTLFAGINQSFFMGLFFLISGCFVATSLNRKSSGQFIREKLIRLGIPVALFIFLVYPLTIWVGYYPWTWNSFVHDVPKLLADISLAHTGPTWFILVLLIFNLVTILLKTSLQRMAEKIKIFSGIQFALIGFAVGVVSFLTRLYFPDGFTVLNVQISYMPQYIFYFFSGVLLGISGITRIASHQKIWLWLLSAVVMFLVMVVSLGIVGHVEPFKGGLNPWALVYSLVQGFHSIAFSILYLAFFHRIGNAHAWLQGHLSKAAYGAFFIHALVIVGISIALKDLALAPLVKFLLVGVIGVLASFLCGYLLAKAPLLKRVF